jgi:hypothetical protein
MKGLGEISQAPNLQEETSPGKKASMKKEYRANMAIWDTTSLKCAEWPKERRKNGY